jgi:hypothetical protein
MSVIHNSLQQLAGRIAVNRLRNWLTIDSANRGRVKSQYEVTPSEALAVGPVDIRSSLPFDTTMIDFPILAR